MLLREEILHLGLIQYNTALMCVFMFESNRPTVIALEFSLDHLTEIPISFQEHIMWSECSNAVQLLGNLAFKTSFNKICNDHIILISIHWLPICVCNSKVIFLATKSQRVWATDTRQTLSFNMNLPKC